MVKRKKKKKTGQVKVAGARLEGFMDWTNSGINESVEEQEEAKMSSLVSSFAVMMHKRAASA